MEAEEAAEGSQPRRDRQQQQHKHRLQQQRQEDEFFAEQGADGEAPAEGSTSAAASASGQEDYQNASLIVHDESQNQLDASTHEPRSPLRPLALQQQQQHNQHLYGSQRTPSRIVQRPPLPQPPRSRFASSPMGGYDTAGSMAFEYARPHYASPRSAGMQPSSAGSSLPYGTGSRLDAEMGRSLSAGLPRSPGSSVPRFFVTVLPPADLSRTTSHNRHPSSAGSSHLRRGALMPLYPTLGGQLYAISREYGLPSIGGLNVYLADDGDGNPGPRISEETWPYLWVRYFDRGADDIYHDLTTPARMPTPVAASPSSFPSGHTDYASVHTSHPTAVLDTSDNDGSQDALPFGAQLPRRAPPSSTLSAMAPRSVSHQLPPSLSPHVPERARAASSMSFGSQSNPATPFSRLPIVAKIEWAVDPLRAPWWTQWSNQAAQPVSELAMSSRQPSSNSERQNMQRPSVSSAGKRSLRLPQLRNTSAPHYPVSDVARRDSGTTDQERMTSERSGAVVSRQQSVASHGYAPLEDEAEGYTEDSPDHAATGAGVPHLVASGSADTLSASLTPQGPQRQSVHEDLDSRDRSTEAAETEDDVAKSQRSSAVPGLGLSVDESSAVAHTRQREISEDQESENALRKVTSPPERSNMTVREWISKTTAPATPRADAYNGSVRSTQAPPTNTSITSSEYDALLAEEQLLPPENDFEEVLGLWKEKAISSEGVPFLQDAAVAPSSVQRSSIVSAATLNKSATSARSSRISQRQSIASLAEAEESKRASLASRRSRNSGQNEASDADLASVSVPIVEEQLSTETGADRSAPDAAVTRASLASLRSPIALLEDTSSFQGPAPELGSLTSSHDQALTVPWHSSSSESEAMQIGGLHENNLLAVDTSAGSGQVDSADDATSTSSEHLTIPLPPANLKRSDSTASSVLSDTLIDMERALELLSPAVPSENTPVMDDSADSKWSKRTTPRLSASESMQRARTLSASVSPHPNWFRARAINANDVIPPLPVQSSDATAAASSRASVPADAAPKATEAQDAAAARPQSSPAVPKNTHKRSQSRFSAQEIMAAAAASNQLKQRLSMEPAEEQRLPLSQRQSNASLMTTSLYSVDDLASYDGDASHEHDRSTSSGPRKSVALMTGLLDPTTSSDAQQEDVEDYERENESEKESALQGGPSMEDAARESLHDDFLMLSTSESRDVASVSERSDVAAAADHAQPSSYHDTFDNPGLGAKSADSSAKKLYKSPALFDLVHDDVADGQGVPSTDDGMSDETQPKDDASPEVTKDDQVSRGAFDDAVHQQPGSYHEMFEEPSYGARAVMPVGAKVYQSPATPRVGQERSIDTTSEPAPQATAPPPETSPHDDAELEASPESVAERSGDAEAGDQASEKTDYDADVQIHEHAAELAGEQVDEPSREELETGADSVQPSHEESEADADSVQPSHEEPEAGAQSLQPKEGEGDVDATGQTDEPDASHDVHTQPHVAESGEGLLKVTNASEAQFMVTSPSTDSIRHANSADDIFMTPAQTPNPPPKEAGEYMGMQDQPVMSNTAPELTESPRTSTNPAYNTVGVQVQTRSQHPDDTLYSHASGDDSELSSLDTNSDREADSALPSPPQAGSDDAAEAPRVAYAESSSDAEATSEATPSTVHPARFASRETNNDLLSPNYASTEFDNRSNESLMAFARLIRGDSFSTSHESSATSSIDERAQIGNASSPLASSSEQALEEDEENAAHEAAEELESGDETQMGRGHSRDTTQTSTSGEGTARDSGIPSLNRWSADSKNYAQSDADGEQDAKSETQGSQGLSSHLSTRSQSGDISELSGIRTPTFYYDTQLTGDEANSRYSGSQRMSSHSGSQAASRNSPLKSMSRSSSFQPGTSYARPTEALSPLSSSLASTEALLSHGERVPVGPAATSLAGQEGFESLGPNGMTASSLSMPHLTRSADSTPASVQQQAQSYDTALPANSKQAPDNVFSGNGSPPRARRSLGALIERKRKSLGVRRASASNSSPGGHQHNSPGGRQSGHVITLTEPTPPRGMPMASDGSALPAFRASGTSSPRRRFGVLPPSPSLNTSVPIAGNATSPVDLGPATQNGRVVPWMATEGYFAGQSGNGSPSKPNNSKSFGRFSLASPRSKSATRRVTPSSVSATEQSTTSLHDDDPFRASRYSSAEEGGKRSPSPWTADRNTKLSRESTASSMSSSRGSAFAFAGATTSPDLTGKAQARAQSRSPSN